MGEIARRIVDDYRNARKEKDYPTQAGILISLLRSMLHGTGTVQEVAEGTSREVLQAHKDTQG